MTAPMWGEHRNRDWERSVARECPDLLPVWAEGRKSLRERLRRLWGIVESTLAVTGWLLLAAFVLTGVFY